MIKLRFWIFAVFIFAFLCGNAKIEWLATEYDFGAFKEAGGPKTGSVQFINRGPKAIMINQVRPSCGCTGAEFTQGEIMPGDTATISFTYNPLGRPGRFDKTVKVYTGADNERTTIRIYGTVIGAPASLETSYPIEVGPLRLSEKIILAGDVNYGSARHLFFQGYNQSSDTIYPGWVNPARSLSLGISNRGVPPGDLVTFSIYFNSREGEMPGQISYPIEIIADTTISNSPKTTVEFRAKIIPQATGIGASQLSNAPILSVSPPTIDLGNVGNSANFSFVLTNKGKSDLHIQRIKGENVKMKKFPSRLSPGKSGECVATINLSELKPDPFSLRLEIVSNDPVNPLYTVRIAGIKE